MSAWAIWLLVAAGLVVGEVLTLTFMLAMAAAAAAVAAGVAALGLAPVWQVLAFMLVAVATVGLVRPFAQHRLHALPGTRTGVAALVGKQGIVLSRVDGDGGQIKLAGEVWSARAWDGRQVMEPGDHVEVVTIEGATALVLKGD